MGLLQRFSGLFRGVLPTFRGFRVKHRVHAGAPRAVKAKTLLTAIGFGMGIATSACEAALSDLGDYTFREQSATAGAGGESVGNGGGAGAGLAGSAGAGQSGAGGTAPLPACQNGALKCSGDSVQECIGTEWGDPVPCREPNPVCNGGACGPLRLSGGLVSSSGTLGTTELHLVDHGFESLPTVCRMVNGSNVCVTGGLRP